MASDHSTIDPVGLCAAADCDPVTTDGQQGKKTKEASRA